MVQYAGRNVRASVYFKSDQYSISQPPCSTKIILVLIDTVDALIETFGDREQTIVVIFNLM